MKMALTFDDVLLVPSYSEVTPSQVNIESKFTKNVYLKAPVSSSAMDTVTETSMACAMFDSGGIGIIHKNNTIEEQMALVQACILWNPKIIVGAAIGVAPDWRVRLNAMIRAGATVIVLDSAHGHSANILTLAKTIKKDLPGIELVAGNVATYDGALALCDAGVDAVKVGIGPGSICTTRVVSGVGIPQFTAIQEAVRACDSYGVPVIADGGIRTSGDVVKALAVGADSVMIGSMFAGTDESPGSIIEHEGKKYKSYRGMGSASAMAQGSKDRYFQQDAKKFVPEGVESIVPYKGSVREILFQLLGGLRSGMGYCGAPNIPTLQATSQFVQITSAGLRESHVHDVKVT
jgi:IMP dehydrogenase